MQRKAIFNNKLLPYLLLAPQLAITFVFFFWPAGEAVWYSFIRQDAFGISKQFVWFENFTDLFADPLYHQVIINTIIFSVSVTFLSMAFALGLAVLADRHIRGKDAYRTLLIWPYAVAPAVAGHVPGHGQLVGRVFAEFRVAGQSVHVAGAGHKGAGTIDTPAPVVSRRGAVLEGITGIGKTVVEGAHHRRGGIGWGLGHGAIEDKRRQA